MRADVRVRRVTAPAGEEVGQAGRLRTAGGEVALEDEDDDEVRFAREIGDVLGYDRIAPVTGLLAITRSSRPANSISPTCTASTPRSRNSSAVAGGNTSSMINPHPSS